MAYNQIAECFAEYAIGTCFLLLRLFSRVRMAGVCGLQLDDAFAIMAIVSSFRIIETSIDSNVDGSRSSSPSRPLLSTFLVCCTDPTLSIDDMKLTDCMQAYSGITSASTPSPQCKSQTAKCPN